MKNNQTQAVDPKDFCFADLIPSKNGFITLDREFINWPLFYDADAWHLFFYLMTRANFKTKQYNQYVIYRGSLMTSYAHLADALMKSKDQIKHTLAKLKRINEIKTTRLGNATLITLLNYNKYQRLNGDELDKLARPTPDLSSTCPPSLPTTNKSKQSNNVIMKKNYKAGGGDFGTGMAKLGDVLKMGMGRMAPPELIEVKQYCEASGYQVDYEAFYHYYERRGWSNNKGEPITSWKKALNGWVKVAHVKLIDEMRQNME